MKCRLYCANECLGPGVDHSRTRTGCPLSGYLVLNTDKTMFRVFSLPLIAIMLLAVPMSVSGGLTNEPENGASTVECSFAPDIPPMDDFRSLVSVSDPFLGSPEAKHTVMIFFDPNCPHCATFHPIMKQVARDMGQHARFYMIPFPLWRYSLAQTEALYVAAEEGKFYEMIDAQYTQQKPGGMSVEDLVRLAAEVGLDPDRFRERLERGQNQPMIMSRRARIAEAGIRGTPSVMINGRVVASASKSRVCMNELIAAEVSGDS